MKRGISIALRLLLAGVFLFAGISKATDPSRFALDIQGYRLVPERMLMPAALYLPWLEIVCGISILSGVGLRGGLVVTSALLSIFLGAMMSAVIRGVDIRCGCFGDAADRPGLMLPMLRNFLLLLAAAAVVWLRRSSGQGADGTEAGRVAAPSTA